MGAWLHVAGYAPVSIVLLTSPLGNGCVAGFVLGRESAVLSP